MANHAFKPSSTATSISTRSSFEVKVHTRSQPTLFFEVDFRIPEYILHIYLPHLAKLVSTDTTPDTKVLLIPSDSSTVLVDEVEVPALSKFFTYVIQLPHQAPYHHPVHSSVEDAILFHRAYELLDFPGHATWFVNDVKRLMQFQKMSADDVKALLYIHRNEDGYVQLMATNFAKFGTPDVVDLVLDNILLPDRHKIVVDMIEKEKAIERKKQKKLGMTPFRSFRFGV